MNCFYYEHVTDAYLSGEIEGPEWRAHLEGCHDCAAKLRSESDFDLIVRHAVNSERLQTRQLEAHVRSAIRKSKAFWGIPVPVMLRYGVAATVVLSTLALATIGYAKGRMDRTAVCSDAADDHQQEIVEKAPLKWKANPKDVEALSKRVTGDPTIAERVTPAGYHLIGARVCILHGKDYMHLDFSNGSNEISLFLRHQDRTFTSRILAMLSASDSDVDRYETLTVGATQKHDLSLVLVSASPIPDVQSLVEGAASKL